MGSDQSGHDIVSETLEAALSIITIIVSLVSHSNSQIFSTHHERRTLHLCTDGKWPTIWEELFSVRTSDETVRHTENRVGGFGLVSFSSQKISFSLMCVLVVQVWSPLRHASVHFSPHPLITVK